MALIYERPRFPRRGLSVFMAVNFFRISLCLCICSVLLKQQIKSINLLHSFNCVSLLFGSLHYNYMTVNRLFYTSFSYKKRWNVTLVTLVTTCRNQKIKACDNFRDILFHLSRVKVTNGA